MSGWWMHKGLKGRVPGSTGNFVVFSILRQLHMYLKQQKQAASSTNNIVVAERALNERVSWFLIPIYMYIIYIYYKYIIYNI